MPWDECEGRGGRGKESEMGGNFWGLGVWGSRLGGDVGLGMGMGMDRRLWGLDFFFFGEGERGEGSELRSCERAGKRRGWEWRDDMLNISFIFIFLEVGEGDPGGSVYVGHSIRSIPLYRTKRPC